MLSYLLLALLQAAPAQAPAETPAWTFHESTDATTGKKSATAFVRAADGSARLIVRCDTAAIPIVSIQYIPKPPLAASDPMSVTVTFDESQAEIGPWQFPGAGAYVGDGVTVFQIADKIAKSKTIRVTIVKPDDSVAETTFVGPGDDAKFRQVYAACGFPYQQPAPPLTKDVK